MAQTSKNIPGAAVRGAAYGVLFMSFFGTLWASIGMGGLQGWGFPWLLIAAVTVGIALLTGGISLILTSRRLSNQVSEADAQHWKRVGIWFGIIFTTEGMAIGLASAICNATNHFDFLFPVMAIIVGVHFFPLAFLLQVRTHYIAGALLCLLSIITLLLVPARVTFGDQQIIAWWTVVGFGSALILWGTGLAIWLLGKRMLGSTPHKPT
jgi:hypothetical protein